MPQYNLDMDQGTSNRTTLQPTLDEVSSSIHRAAVLLGHRTQILL